MSQSKYQGYFLLKIAGSNPFKWAKRGQDAARGLKTTLTKPVKKKPGSFKVKALGVGTVFGAGAYTDHAMKLRARAKNPYNT